MSKHTSISNLAVLRTATVLLALATGVFSSRADHFEWSEPSGGGAWYSGPTSDRDDFYEWSKSSYAEVGDSVSGSTVDWYGYVQSVSQVDTQVHQPITSGHTLSTYAEAQSQFGGEWVSDEDGPPADATIDYTAEVWGTVFGTTQVYQQGIHAITNFIAKAQNEASYVIDYNPLLYGGIGLNGGIIYGFGTNDSMWGNAGYENLDINPVDYDLHHTIGTDPYEEEWVWWQKVDFSLEVSDSYTVDVNDVYVDPDIIAWTYAYLLIYKGESASNYFGAEAEASCDLSATFSYTVTPNY